MLDIDFLQSEKPTLRQHVVYAYESGLILPKVVAKLRTLFEAKGLIFQEPEDYSDVLSTVWEVSLFGEQAVFIDLAKMDAKLGLQVGEQLLKDLLAKSPENTVILAVPEHDLRKSGNWTTITKAATFLEEPEVTKPRLAAIVDFFADACQVYNFKQLKNRPDMHRAFEEIYQSADEYTLVDVRQQVDFFALTCISAETNEFDAKLFRMLAPPATRQDFYALHFVLYDFLATPTIQKAGRLIEFFDKQIHQELKEPRMILGSLYRATRDLITVNALLHPKFETPTGWSAYKTQRLRDYSSISLVSLFYWQIGLLRFEANFSKHNPTVAMFELCSGLIEHLRKAQKS